MGSELVYLKKTHSAMKTNRISDTTDDLDQ